MKNEQNQTILAGKVPAGYQQTEVGIIPEDWEVKRLFDVSCFKNGMAHEDAIDEFGKYVLVNSKFISTEGQVVKFTSENRQPVFKDDVLMVMSDVPNGKAIAKCYLVDENDRYTLNQRICALTSRNIIPAYLFYILNRNKYYLSFDDGVKQTNLRRIDVLNCPLPIPPLKEQTAIAEALSDVDSLLVSLEKLIEKKRVIKTGTMQQLLTGKRRLPAFAQREDGTPKGYKTTELGEIPEDWEVVKLGDICSTYSGGTPLTSNKEYYDGSIKWITSSDLNKRVIYGVENSITQKGLDFSSAKMIAENTLLMALYGATAGITAISKIAGAINQAILAINPYKDKSEYLWHWLTFYKNKIIDTYTQGGQPNLSGDIVKSIKLDLPPVTEQTAIAEILSDMDAEIEALEAKRTKTEEIKQGMMQELLTGRTRLV